MLLGVDINGFSAGNPSTGADFGKPESALAVPGG
jgi:hypothetical protein